MPPQVSIIVDCNHNLTRYPLLLVERPDSLFNPPYPVILLRQPLQFCSTKEFLSYCVPTFPQDEVRCYFSDPPAAHLY
jgi:hypothetical protein